jgi:hypothetical protein
MTRAFHYVSGSKKRLTLFGATMVFAAATLAAVAYLSTTGSGSNAAGATGSFTAATISAPSNAGASFSITWTDQASLGSAIQNPHITYEVQRKLGAGSFSDVSSGPCSGSLAYNTSMCTDTVGSDGVYTYQVIAHFNSWTATSNQVTVNSDATPPASAITFPADGGSYNTAGWNAGCTSAICGSASDPGSNPSGVFHVFVEVIAPNGKYWDGAGFNTMTETAEQASGTTSWSYAFPATNFLVDGDYTVKSYAIDNAGNTQSPLTTASFTIDTVAPTVTSINREAGSTNPTNTGPLSWTVTFSKPVKNVVAGDFSIPTSNTTGTPTIDTVTPDSGPPSAIWTVTVDTTGVTGANNGSIGLNLSSTGTIKDGAGNALSATTPVVGQTFTYDTTAPTVSSINRNDTSPTKLGTVHWAVTISESVSGVDSTDFSLVGAGASGASITNVTGSGSSYTVTVTTGSDGSLGLNLVDDDSITDAAGNKLGGTGTGNGNFTGQAYVVDKTAPAPTIGATTPSAFVNSTTPSIAGTAGTQAGDANHSADSTTVTVNIYSGPDTSGTLLQSFTPTVSAGSWSVSESALAANAQYTVQVTQNDGAGNSGSATKTFVIDTASPAPTIGGSTPAAFVNSTTPTISGTAGTQGADATHSADNTTVTVGIYAGATATGSPVQSFTPTVSGGNWSISESALTANAQYTIKVSQGDGAGNSGSSTRTFVVDTVSPAPTIGANTPAAYVNSQTPTISGTAGTQGADSTHSADNTFVNVSIFTGSVASGTPIQSFSPTLSSGNWTWTPSTLPANAQYTVEVTQFDAAGNAGSQDFTFVVDKVNPIVTLTAPANNAKITSTTPTFSGAAGTVSASSTASDDSNTVTVYICSGNQSSCGSSGPSLSQTRTATQSGGSWSVSASPALSAGTYTAQAAQDDAAGNTGASTANTFTIGVAPTITSANLTTFMIGSTSNTFPVSATGTASITLSETGALPNGVTFVDNGGGSATLSGNPALGTNGTYPITITASNGFSPDATQSFTLTVNNLSTSSGSYSVVVPPGHSTVTYTVCGAGGAGSAGATGKVGAKGGDGACATGTIAVPTSGTTLTAIVGQGGRTTSGTATGRGTGASAGAKNGTAAASGGGGGASALQVSGSNLVVVGAGGGAAGANTAQTGVVGGAGGIGSNSFNGTAGADGAGGGHGKGGGGATTTTAGIAGVFTGSGTAANNGSAGSGFNGGSGGPGTNNGSGGGGGGGGLFGGGGGAGGDTNGGGAGGGGSTGTSSPVVSGFTYNTAVSSSASAGNGGAAGLAAGAGGNGGDGTITIGFIAPTVTSVNPLAGSTNGGTSVTVTGSDLGGATAVNFGATPGTAIVVNATGTSLTVTSPAHSAGQFDVTVVGPGGTSATSGNDKFTFDATPTITGIAPSTGSAAGGTPVTVTGTGFLTATAVAFGGTAGTGLSITSDTSLTITSPVGSAGTVHVTVTNPTGTSATSGSDQFTYVAPATVTNVTSTLGNGAYKAGQLIPISVTFSTSVNVTGIPTLTLATAGTVNEAVNYTSGSGSNTLLFNYTVQAGDTSADLNYLSTSALALNGGTITNSGLNSVLTLPALNGAGSLATNKNIVVDTTAPSGGAVTVNGTTASGAGSTSATTNTGFTIGPRSDYTDTNLASSTLTVQSETLTNSVCGALGSGGPFTSPTTVTGTAQPGVIQADFCYVYTLTGTDNAGNTSVISTTVTVTGTANKLAFTTQPAGATPGTAFTTQPVVAVQDAAGNTVLTDTSSVTLTIASGSPSGTLTCTPGTNVQAAVAGVATFVACRIDNIGTGYKLHAADGGLTATDSSAFNVTGITFVGEGTVVTTTTANQSNTVNYPASSQTGDLLILITTNSHHECSPTSGGGSPTGWSLAASVPSQPAGGNEGCLQAFYKFDAGVSDTSVTLNSPGGAGTAWSARVIAYRGVNATALDVAAATSAPATLAGSTFGAPGLSTVTANAMAISIVYQNDAANGVPTLNFAGGGGNSQSFALRFSDGIALNGASNSAGVADKLISAAGSVTFPTWTTGTTAAKSFWIGISIALRPA